VSGDEPQTPLTTEYANGQNRKVAHKLADNKTQNTVTMDMLPPELRNNPKLLKKMLDKMADGEKMAKIQKAKLRAFSRTARLHIADFNKFVKEEIIKLKLNPETDVPKLRDTDED
jgi:hypothetical protein